MMKNDNKIIKNDNFPGNDKNMIIK